MVTDLGELEVDQIANALECLYIFKIMKEHNDFSEQWIDLLCFDYEYMQYNNSYNVAHDFAKNILETICPSADIIPYSEEHKYIVENLIEESIIKDCWDDLENCLSFLVIPLKKNDEKKINTIIDHLNKKITVGGIVEDYLSRNIYHAVNEQCLYIAIDLVYLIDVVINSEFINLLYEYKAEGIL